MFGVGDGVSDSLRPAGRWLRLVDFRCCFIALIIGPEIFGGFVWLISDAASSALKIGPEIFGGFVWLISNAASLPSESVQRSSVASFGDSRGISSAALRGDFGCFFPNIAVSSAIPRRAGAERSNAIVRPTASVGRIGGPCHDKSLNREHPTILYYGHQLPFCRLIPSFSRGRDRNNRSDQKIERIRQRRRDRDFWDLSHRGAGAPDRRRDQVSLDADNVEQRRQEPCRPISC